MDIKAKINEIVDKIKNDDGIKEEFKKNPEAAVEKLLGVDIPDGITDKIVDGVKAKLTGDSLSGAMGKLKNLF